MKTYVSIDPAESNNVKQFTTFYIDGRLYGIDVMKVQEVTMPLPSTPMRTAPPYIKGVINLRGQITTAIGLRELFNLAPDPSLDKMTIVCRVDDILISFLVDNIGDVLEFSQSQYEATPPTISDAIRPLMQGIYKLEGTTMSVLSLDSILHELEKRCG